MDEAIMQKATFSELCRTLDHREDSIKNLIMNIFKTGLLFIPGMTSIFDSTYAALDAGLVLIDSISTVGSVITELANIVGKKNSYTERSQEAMTVHILMVFSAYFDTIRDYLPDENRQIKLTKQEKATITQESLDTYWGRLRNNSLDPATAGKNRIYDRVLQLPNPIDGQEGTMKELLTYYEDLNYYFKKFINGLVFVEKLNDTQKANLECRLEMIPELAVSTYRSQYYTLATMYPEFFVYTNQQEHRELNKTINRGFRDIPSQLREFSDEKVHDAFKWLLEDYRTEVEAPIFKETDIGSSTQIIYPQKNDIFIPQRFRALRYKKGIKLEPKETWEDCILRTDICGFISSTLCHNEAGSKPLIILGHPGAGKTLLCLMLAAQCLNRQFHPIIVRLRKVTAGSTIEGQINEQLEDQLHNRCLWVDIMKSKPQKPILIFFDGYDELLQASGNYYSDYINQIHEFQTTQSRRHGAIVRCILTSRLNLIDKAHIPSDCTIISLSDLQPDQIEAWCEEWNKKNAEYYQSNPSFSQFHVSPTSKFFNLAVQPLLLSMLALYDSEGNALLDSETLTGTELYNNLIRRFIVREQQKNKNVWDTLSDVQRNATVEKEIQKLSITAMGMFNRQTLFLRSSQISNDLKYYKLEEQSSGDIELGKFLFGHYTKCTVNISGKNYERYAYEFIHDTFCEFLIARYIVDLLQKLDADNPSIEWYSALIYAPLFMREKIVNMIEEWSSVTFQTCRVKNTLSKLLDREAFRLLSGEIALPIIEVISDCHLQKHLYSKHVAIYMANIMHLRLLLGRELTLRPVDFHKPEKSEEVEHLQAKKSIDIWQYLFDLWRSAFQIEEYEQFTSYITANRTDGLCQLRYTERMNERNDGVLSKIYYSAEHVGDSLLMALTGVFKGEESQKVLYALEQNQISAKTQYWFGILLLRIQRREKYSQVVRDALYEFRNACYDETQFQYLSLFYTLYKNILEINEIATLTSGNSRKAAQMIVSDQQEFLDLYIQGQISKDYMTYARNLCFDFIQNLDFHDNSTVNCINDMFVQMNDLSDLLGAYYFSKFYNSLFDYLYSNKLETEKYFSHDICKHITDKVSFILKNNDPYTASDKRVFHEIPSLIYALCCRKEFTFAVRLLHDYSSNVLEPSKTNTFKINAMEGCYIIQCIYLILSWDKNAKKLGAILNRLLNKVSIMDMYDYLPRTTYWICKMYNFLSNANRINLHDSLLQIRQERKMTISLELDYQIKSILDENTKPRRDKKKK